MSLRSRAAAAGTASPLTTGQRLGSVIKSARDIMRKDKGLNGDLDRLPMLIWIMFLKFLDDLEQVREAEATLEGRRFVPALLPPYRWRDWAAPDDGLSGEALISFINNERATLPDRGEGPGLFAYLRGLQGLDGGDRRDVIATVFRGTVNRMINGYLLRDVVNKVDDIHFASSDEIHTLSSLYESMLREMRDAAGDSGEFYTPRPLVWFMVRVCDPQVGEIVLDPACGTGGFLVEAYLHMLAGARTVDDRQTLERGVLGGEAKPLPYLLAQMNLLLHGIETPQISAGNSLAVRLSEIGERDRVDVVLTNPPFGGEEERGILDNFPADRQTAETALLFLQLIMRKLKRTPGVGGTAARAAVVVPNGTLFGDGISGRIKQELLTEFNLHTVVRLPNGVFAPYTNIPTNVLFFDRSTPGPDVWFYELIPPDGRKQFTKTSPIGRHDFDECLVWMSSREESDRAWKVPLSELVEAGANLDRRNPSRQDDSERRGPGALVAEMVQAERAMLAALERVQEYVRELER